MNRKKVDNRIRVLIENGVALRYRTMFVIIGDKGRDQVIVNLCCALVRILDLTGCVSSSHAV